MSTRSGRMTLGRTLAVGCLGLLAAVTVASTAWAQEGDPAEEADDAEQQAVSNEAPRYADIPMQLPPEPQGDLEGDIEILGNPFDFGGYFWVDTGVLDRTNGQEGDPNQRTYYMNGRFVASAAYGVEMGEWFAMSRLEFMGLVNEFAKSAYEPHALDVFLRIGHERWGDITIGRFLGWEAYYRGQGIELFTAEEAGALDAPRLYDLGNTRGYRNEAGQLALHLYPHEFLALEVAGVYGQENNQNNLGVRPIVYFDVAGFVAVAGLEYQHQFAINENDRVDVEQLGFSGQLRYTIAFITIGGNFSQLDQDRIDIQGEADTAQSFVRNSAGGFLDLDFGDHVFGGAYHHTWEENDRNETQTHDQITGTYMYRTPFDGLSIKAVYGYADASLESVDANQQWGNNLHSVRLRLQYYFE